MPDVEPPAADRAHPVDPNRRAGRVVYYRLADDFPEPLRADCLRGLIGLVRRRTDSARNE